MGGETGGETGAPAAGFEPKMLNKGKLWENLRMSTHFKPSRKGKPNTPNQVRIIGGRWRSRVIDFADADGLRPTANRVRETLFNWLGQSLHDRRCLDLFAGSGALGFEAASRGAVEVVMVESNRRAAQSLADNCARLDASACRVVTGEAINYLDRNPALFDVIFVDPPFASALLQPLLPRLAAHVAPEGMVYVEWGAPVTDALAQLPRHPWRILKQGRAGVVHFALLSLAEGAS